MRKFTKIFQMLIIFVLSSSLAFGQNYSKKEVLSKIGIAPSQKIVKGSFVKPGNSPKGSTAWLEGLWSPDFGTCDADLPTTTWASISNPASWNAYGGDYDNLSPYYYYVIDANDGYLKMIDVSNGAIIRDVGNVNLGGSSFTGMACDRTTGVMYVIAWNGTDTDLFTLDVNTGLAILIGTSGVTSDILIDMAIDGTGTMYAWGLDDNTYTVNLATGASTLVGPTGVDLKYAQGGAWDPLLDIVYAAAYNNAKGTPEMYTVNRATGAFIYVNPLIEESDAMGFPNPQASPVTDVLVGSVDAPLSGILGNAETVTVTVYNIGTTTEGNIPVSYTLDGGAAVNEIMAGPLAPNSSASYSFTGTADCSAVGPHQIVACTGITYDNVPTNDCSTYNFSALPTGDCQHQIDLYDTYGDSWNGGMIDVLVNGTVVLDDITLASGSGPATFYYYVSTGDVVTTVFTAGGWPEENYYEIYDDLGTFIIGSGPQAGGPPDILYNAVCAGCCDHQICLEDSYGDGWNGGFVDVYVDGSPVLTGITIVTGSGPDCTNFTACNGADIDVYYTAGGWPEENSYYVLDGLGTIIGNAPAQTGGPGDLLNLVGNCTAPPPPGNTCSDPIVIASLAYTTTDNTSNYGDDYSSADEICSSSSYLNGDDVVYSYTPATDECIDITLTNTGTWVGLFVYEGCDPFTVCVGSDKQSGGNPSLSGLSLTGGTTYYIIISTWPSPQSTAYDMDVDICPACPAPTNQQHSNETQNGADLSWDFPAESFFDVYVDVGGGPPGPGTTPTASNVPGNSYTWSGGAPSTSYDWYVRTNCGFTENAKVDYFWMAMDAPGNLLDPPLSGGTVDDPGETGLWYEYYLAPDPWWNIWFYNDDYDPTRVKLIRMGFWIQSYQGLPGELYYVVNWSNDLYPNGTGTFPTPEQENWIARSPINVPITVSPGAPQWIELTYLIEDYNPEWVSVDIWGENIQILEIGDPPPAGSPLLEWWVQGSPGGIIVHECLPADLGDNKSEWTGPDNFTTLNPPPANDLCANAISVDCGSVTSGTTVDATNSGMPTCGVTQTAPEVWYHFVGTGQMVSADLCTNTTYDTKLTIWEGTCAALICVDGNDDYCSLQSRVDWYAASGTDYYIMVHGYSTNTGNFDLTIDCTSPATAVWEGDDSPYYDWFGADNWDVQDVPGSTTDVTIPAGLLTTHYPTIDRTAVCDDILLGSDATGTATLLGNEFLTLSKGTATVQRYYPTGAPTFDEWHLISAPISNAQAGIYTGYYLQWYEENPPGITPPIWHDVTLVTDPLTSLQGFAFYASADGMTFNYVGALGDGIYNILISAAGTVNWHWNLFGNPYPSALDWDVVAPANIANLQTGAIYYLNQVTGAYVSYNGGMGGGVRYVPPGQGFFVSGAIDMAPFVVDNTMRTHTGGSTYYKSDFENLLVLEAAGNDFTDATYLRFDEGASEEIDQLDAFKLFTTSNPNLPQLYTVGGDKLSINVLPETEMVPAGFKAGTSGIYTINIKEVTGMANVILEDLINGTQTDLMNNPYTFNYNVDDQENRFIIHFTPLTVPETFEEMVNIFSFNTDVYVTVPVNTEGNIFIYNMMGQEVASKRIDDVQNIITLEKSSYYVVKVLSDESVVTKKVFIK